MVTYSREYGLFDCVVTTLMPDEIGSAKLALLVARGGINTPD